MAIRTILVGVDDSPGSRRALQWAAELAAQARAELILVHVYEPLAHLDELGGGIDLRSLRETAHAKLEREMCAPLRAQGILRAAHTREGLPHEALLDCAREEAADVIVVGARRMGLLKTLALGSTSHKLGASSPIPVVIVPPATA